MSTICNLDINPSKVSSKTLNTVNCNYWTALHQSQIVIEDNMLIFNETIDSLTNRAIFGPHFFRALFKLNNFLNFCPLTTFDSSKCSCALQLE
jgi:hypothetical protein